MSLSETYHYTQLSHRRSQLRIAHRAISIYSLRNITMVLLQAYHRRSKSAARSNPDPTYNRYRPAVYIPTLVIDVDADSTSTPYRDSRNHTALWSPHADEGGLPSTHPPASPSSVSPPVLPEFVW